MTCPINCTEEELSTYLRALEAGYLPTCNLDTNQSAPSKLISIASKPWQHGKKMGSFPGFPSIQMFKNSMGALGADSLTSSQEGFRAKICLAPVEGQASPEKNQDYGLNSLASFAKFDRATSLWRTPQCSLLGDSELYSETWPQWGLMVAGVCWEQIPSAPRTSGNGSGLWPTPTICGNHNRKGASATSGDGLATVVKQSPDRYWMEGQLNPVWVAWLMGWPHATGWDWTSLEPAPAEIVPTDWTREPDGIPRTATKIPNRVDRLKALGNGQVPQCAAMAWRLLTESGEPKT